MYKFLCTRTIQHYAYITRITSLVCLYARAYGRRIRGGSPTESFRTLMVRLKNIAYTCSMPRLIDSCGLCRHGGETHAITQSRIYFARHRARGSFRQPIRRSPRSLILSLRKTALWHYVIHYGLRLRYILLYVAPP